MRTNTYSEAISVKQELLAEKSFVKTTDNVGIDMDPHKTSATATIEWRNVNLVLGKKKKQKLILDNCSGITHNNELTAIIGPSGAGKTSLLNVLARRITTGVSDNAEILLNGRPMSVSKGSEIAYVTQEDSIYPQSTVREALMFSAELRLPSEVSTSDKRKKVEQIIADLGLEKCAETQVGSVLKRGISGGEKKRTSIGIELITDPEILFLDEPTSGLDSFAASQTISLLKTLSSSDRGCIVLCTIHQPSSEVFSNFDKVIVLANGKIMYGGQTSTLVSHFAALNYQCPALYSISEYILYLMQTLDEKALTTLKDSWDTKAAAIKAASVSVSSGGRVVRDSSGYGKASWFKQTSALAVRELRGTIRNKPALYARYGITACLNLLFALIFKNSGAWTQVVDGELEPNDIQTHFGGITQIVISAMFSAAQPMMLEFPLERPIFIREYATDHYGASSYFLSKLLVELPLSFVQSLVIFLVAYWLMDLQGNIMMMVLITWMLSVVSASVALLLGCALPDVKAAVQLSPIIFVPQLLFAGFFIKISQIPIFLQWAQYLCSLKFAMNMFMIVEFGAPCEVEYLLDHGVPNATIAAEVHEQCVDLLELNQVEENQIGLYAGVLVGIFVIFRSISLMCLKAKARVQH